MQEKKKKNSYQTPFSFLPIRRGRGPGHTPTRYTLKHSFPAGCRDHITNPTFQYSHAAPGFASLSAGDKRLKPTTTKMNKLVAHEDPHMRNPDGGVCVCVNLQSQAVFPPDFYTFTSFKGLHNFFPSLSAVGEQAQFPLRSY